MRLLALALLASSALSPASAFVNTNAGGKVYVCATPQNADLTQGGYEALTWVLITAVGSHGEAGSSTNILTYDTWDTTVVQKGKGLTNAGDPEIEVARIPTDPGQIIMRAAALTNFNYAFKVERNDKVVSTGTPTIIYNRGLVTGPKRPLGRNEDFDLEVFTLALNQKEIVVDPSAAGNPPVATVMPAITGTAQVASVLTSSAGTFTGDATIVKTYRWLAGGVLAAGVNGNSTYLPVAGDVGKVITVEVTGTNAAGHATATSAPTSAVIA